MVLDVSGTAADIERAFHVTLRTYRHPTEARTFFAPDVEPSVAGGSAGFGRQRIERLLAGRVRICTGESAGKSGRRVPKAGSGPDGKYAGNDFRAAYAPGVTLTGSGQTVGLVEFDGYYTSDITNYENMHRPDQLRPVDECAGDSSSGSVGDNMARSGWTSKWPLPWRRACRK